MRRRSFLLITSFSSIGLFIPFVGCNSEQSELNTIFYTPFSLSKIIDYETINELGLIYIEKNPKENTKQMLKSSLVDYDNQQKVNSSSVEKELNRKIKLDFETRNIIILNGWVLSRTEARQCALSSIS